MTAAVKKMTQIIVKEDVVFIKDGAVRQYSSVKEYLEEFVVHLEDLKLKRLVKDEKDLNNELAYLEAKLKFLIYMSQTRRKNEEISQFLTQFPREIASRLSSIQLIKLSSNHIQETEIEIKEIKSRLQSTKKSIQHQQKIVAEIATKQKKSAAVLLVTTNPSINKITDSEIEIFTLNEEEQE
ncbi:hypothetical protein EBU71_15325 [bacterium]|nr:hypothetical protein [Candidatus Elulimicrobium humile]